MLPAMTTVLRWVARIAQVYIAGACLFLLWPPSVFVLLFVLGVRKARRLANRQITTLGSARWAAAQDLKDAGMLSATSGLILGRLPSPGRFMDRFRGSSSRDRGELVRLSKAVHTAVFAPTGVGKGVSLVVPWLLTSSDRSCVCLDFKGELAALTAEHRRRAFGHRVVLLDPYRTVTQAPDTFNPLDAIRADDALAIDDCNDLANALVVRTGVEKDPHWNDSAEAYIAAVAATVVAYGEKDTRSLWTVREIISSPQKLDLAVKLMTESDRWGGALAPMGGQLLHYRGDEKSSVLSSALRHLRFLGAPAVAESVRSSSFDPTELRRGRMTVYLILPPARAQANAGLLRMWIGSLLRACVRGGLQ